MRYILLWTKNPREKHSGTLHLRTLCQCIQLTVGGVMPSAVATPPPPSSPNVAAAAATGPTSGGGAWEHRMSALTLQLSQLQPKLDDLYIKVPVGCNARYPVL
jgi:hypothetical protein